MPPKANPIPRAIFKRTFAKQLRTNATPEERILWSLLRTRQFAGLRFRRQQPIGPYIVDFFCPAAKLIIELDGSQHGTADAVAQDADRTYFLKARGYKVARFWNHDVLKSRDSVLDAIHRTAIQPSP